MKRRRIFTTTRIILIGFLVGITLGTFLLMLPISSAKGEWTNFYDALFMATSSICVTGLATVTPAFHFSLFGQFVILVLIQFGGLGIVTFTTVLLLLVGKRITLADRLLIQDAYNLDTLSGVVRLTIRVVKGTLIVEGIGALLYMTVFCADNEIGATTGIWVSIFTSVSAFCNAGLDLLGDSSLIAYRDNVVVNVTTILLIVLGGLGFPIWWEILRVLRLERKWKWKRSPWRAVNLQTKLVLSATFFLIVSGMLLVLLMEYDNPETLGNLSFGKKLQASLFQSVTLRTAGFATIAQSSFRHVTCLIFVLWMFIGGSPSGTAGGVKTVTMVVIFASVLTTIRGKKDTELYGRRVTDNVVRKALAITGVSLSALFVLTLALMFVQDGDFLDTVFEMVSAIATVGLSRGMTATLKDSGKVILALAMYLGRVGPISMALAFNVEAKERNLKSADGRVTVG